MWCASLSYTGTSPLFWERWSCCRFPLYGLVSRVIPKDPLGSAVTSLLVTVPIGFGMALLGSQLLLNYGWGLFVALPFSVGFTSVLIFEFHERRRVWSSIGVACLATTLLGLA